MKPTFKIICIDQSGVKLSLTLNKYYTVKNINPDRINLITIIDDDYIEDNYFD